jgi:uncharacterized protein YidB (DUF937 family)
MGLLDSVLSSVMNNAGAQQASTAGGGTALVQAAIGLLNSPQVGGLPGLMKLFEQAGAGHVIGSWVGSGANLPISAAQLQQVLSPQLIAGIAQKVGISPDLVTQGLAQVLPHVVDHATPDGQVPANSAVNPLVAEGLGLLEKKLFG